MKPTFKVYYQGRTVLCYGKTKLNQYLLVGVDMPVSKSEIEIITTKKTK